MIEKDEHIRGLVVRPATEASQSELCSYGVEWKRIGNLVTRLGVSVSKAEVLSSSEDVAVASAIVHLLESQTLKDRGGWIHTDLEEIDKKAQVGQLDDSQIGRCLTAIQLSYGLSSDEIAEELHRHRLASIHFMGIAPPVLQFREGALAGNFYHLALLRAKEIEGGIFVTMEPVRDGGIDSVAYPLKGLSVSIREGSPIRTNFSERFFFLRNHGINQELKEHPEIIAKMERGFAGILRRHTDDNDGFIEEREGDGEYNDSTQLKKALFDFILDDYLKRKLDRQTYRQLTAAVNFSNGERVSAIVRLRVLEQELLNPDSYVRKHEFYREQHANELAKVLTLAEERLNGLGAEIVEGKIVNADDLIRRSLRDRRFARSVNLAWKEVYDLADKEIFPASIQNLRQWESIFADDLDKSIIQRALEIARGLIIVTAKDKKDVSLFFVK